MKSVNLDTLKNFYNKVAKLFVPRLYPLVLKPYSAEENTIFKTLDVAYELLIPKKAIASRDNVIIALFKVSDKKWKCKDYNKVTFQNKKWTPLKRKRGGSHPQLGVSRVWGYGKDYDLQRIIAEDEFYNFPIPSSSLGNQYAKINGEEYHRIDFIPIEDTIKDYYIANNPNTGSPKIYLSYRNHNEVITGDTFAEAPGKIFDSGFQFRLYNNWRGPSSYKFASISTSTLHTTNQGVHYKLYPLDKATNIIFGVAAIDVSNAKFLTEIVPIRAEIRPIIKVDFKDAECTTISRTEINWNIRYYQYDKKIQEGVLTASLTRRSE